MSIDVQQWFESLSYDELLELNELIVERLKFLDRQEAHDAMMQFHPGARVEFQSNRGTELGTIMKFNQKTVNVVTDDGRRWKVAPQLLSPAKKTEPAKKPQLTVVDMKKKKFEPPGKA